jgi:hypothetical protein
MATKEIKQFTREEVAKVGVDVLLRCVNSG